MIGRPEVSQPSILGEPTAGILAQAAVPVGLTIAAEREPWARKRALALTAGLTAGLLLAAAIGVPLSTTTHPLTSLSSLGQESPSATAGVPEGDIITYRQAEADAYASFLIPSPEVVAEQAQAEGGYHGRNLFPANSHQRHGH